MSLFGSRSSSGASEKKPSSWRLFSSPDSESHKRRSQSAQRTHYRTHSSIAGKTGNLSPPYSPTLGYGAQVVRTHSQALRGVMRSTPADPHAPAPAAKPSAELPMMQESDRRISRPPRPPMPKSLHKATSMSSIADARRQAHPPPVPPVPSFGDSYRQPPPPSLLPLPALPTVRASASEPFSAILIDIVQRPAPTAEDQVLVNIQFGFSLNDNPDTSAITLPLEMLRRGRGELVAFVDGHIERSKKCSTGGAEKAVCQAGRVSSAGSGGSRPTMTDGESGTDSDLESDEYSATDLLRDEYLKSLWISSPSEPEFDHLPKPAPAPRSSMYLTPPKHRARVRNQYTQPGLLPSPSSLCTVQTPPSALRRRATYLVKPPPEERGKITEITVLLMRDAASWHNIASRLTRGSWPRMDQGRKAAVLQELRWARMSWLGAEVQTSAVQYACGVTRGAAPSVGMRRTTFQQAGLTPFDAVPAKTMGFF